MADKPKNSLAFEADFLPLFDTNGGWIARPDYLLAAVLTQPEPRENWISIQQTYETMCREDELSPTGALSEFSSQLMARRMKTVSDRLRAGVVALELVRLASATGKRPSVGAARRIAAFRSREGSWNTQHESLVRATERSFSAFRDTAHYQAAAVYDPSLMDNIWGNEKGLREFLGLARAFEGFIDRNVVSGSFNWSPLRVPVGIEVSNLISFRPLTPEELRAAQKG